MSFETLVLRSLLIVLVGLGVATCLRRRTAASRHLVYAGIMLSLVLLPVLRQWGPTRTVPVEGLPAPIRELATRIDTTAVPITSSSATETRMSPAVKTHAVVTALLAVWAAGCLFLIARLFIGVILTARLIRRSDRLYVFGSENYEIRAAEGLLVPATTWIGRQVILLPASFESWPQERIRSVVLHEAAHIARRDWFVQFFGRVACALYWPNPLVWLANRQMVEAAEQAADDLVLQAGITPSSYAEDLLQIARSVRRNQPALTIPMAMKNDVGRRIEMVLDNNKRRGSVHLWGLALAALGIAVVTIPAAGLLLHKQADESTIQYADLQGGKTIPGSEANGFIGQLADGRKVELLQVSWFLPDGTLQAWLPNGNLIAPKGQIKRAYHGPDEKDRLEFVYRLKAGGTLVHSGMDLATGSRASGRGEVFAEGIGLPKDGDGNIAIAADMAIRQRGVADPTSFVFYIADTPAMIAASFDEVTGIIKDNPDFPQGLAVDKQGMVHPAKGSTDLPATMVSYNYAANPLYYLTDAVGIDRSGNVVAGNRVAAKRSKGGPIRVTERFPGSDNLVRIEVQLHDLRAVEMRGVHIRPNTLVSD